MRSKDQHLHQDKVRHGRTRNGTKLGDKNVGSERGKANLNDHDRDNPISQSDEAVLDELFAIVFPPATKYPELVQQKVASNSDKVGDGDGNERRQKSTEHGYRAKINDRDASTHSCKTHESGNPLLI